MINLLIEAFSGLGMFLFGMLYMELALKESAGIRFKSWVKNSTSTTFKSLTTGAVATAMLQSSSVITLMTLSFVSASLISLHSGIAVIFGSNVGTTVTSWIVASLGFNVKIEVFALPMVGLGGLLLMFVTEHKKVSSFAKVLVGFGLLFLGLEFMKTSIESIANTINLASFNGYPLILFVGIGFFLTALIQSSSATTAIILSALYANMLSFEQSAAMVIGTNVGTTVTVILGSLGGIPDKKRVALAHFLFNSITAVLAFITLPILLNLLNHVVDIKGDPLTSLALFHTLFNLLGIIILLPFISLMAKNLNLLFIHKKPAPTKFIHLVDPKFHDTALVALKDEVNNLFVKTMKFALLLIHVKPSDVFLKEKSAKDVIELNTESIEFNYKKAYETIKEIEINIVEFVAILNQEKVTVEKSQSLDILLNSVRESVYAAKILKDIKSNIDEFSQSDNETILHIYNLIRKNLIYSIQIYVNYLDEKWTRQQCLDKFKSAKEGNDMITKEATLSISYKGINEKNVISLLNTNRSIFIASEALLDASKSVSLHFPLED